MAFLIENFAFGYNGANNYAVTGSPALNFYGTTDNFATVTASGYFDFLALTPPDNPLQPTQFRVNDLIWVTAADMQAFVKITSNTAPTTVAAIESVPPGSITLAQLGPGITYSSRVILNGKYSYGGGSASFIIPVTGMVATDDPQIAIETSANSVSIYKILPGTNTISVLLSGDPGTSVIAWRVFRNAS